MQFIFLNKPHCWSFFFTFTLTNKTHLEAKFATKLIFNPGNILTSQEFGEQKGARLQMHRRTLTLFNVYFRISVNSEHFTVMTPGQTESPEIHPKLFMCICGQKHRKAPPSKNKPIKAQSPNVKFVELGINHTLTEWSSMKGKTQFRSKAWPWFRGRMINL